MEWQIYTRGTIPLARIHHAFAAIRDYASTYINMPLKNILYLNIGGTLKWAWSKEEMQQLGEHLLNIMKNAEKRAQHFKQMRKLAEQASTASTIIPQKELLTLSAKELTRLYDELYEQEYPAHAWMNTEIDGIDIYPTVHLKERIFAQVPEKEQMNVFARLTAPVYVSYVAEEEIALLEMLERMKKENLNLNDVENDLKNLEQKFWWISLGWESMHVKTVQDFTQDLEQYEKNVPNLAAAVRERRETPEKAIKDRDALIAKYNIDSETVELIKAFEEYTELHDVRKEMQVKTMYAIHLLVLEAARRLEVPWKMVEWFSWEEIATFLESKKFPMDEAERRKKATLMLFKEGTFIFRSGENAIALGKEELASDEHETNDLTGTGASPGVVRGTAKVCSGAKDALRKVGEGDILVCGMTLPDYVPAMRKCAAIVTDEGGVTCHAAIISRELGKPCVIGTQRATDVLKDGMTVEVDADHGLVHVIQE